MKHKGLSILLLFLLLLFAAMPAAAKQMQKFHIESFGENPFDMSAREKPTSRDDGTGVLYAIIKVTSTDPDDDLKAYDLDFDYLKDVQEMHNVECRKDNHKSTTETITVVEGKNTTHALKAPTPFVGVLSLTSAPMRAKITVDGIAHGETPNIIEGLLIGNHKVTLSKEGYESATFDILISENDNIEKSIELKKIERPAPVVAKGNAKNSGNGISANLGSKTSAPYKIGDYYNDGTKEGIVFAISNGGYSGKIVSLEQKKCKWSKKKVETGATSEIDGMYNMQKIRSLSNWQNDYPAFAWCASLGDGWYLPALDELQAIDAKRTAINKALNAKGKPGLSPFYWSSTQVDRVSAWYASMSNGGSTNLDKPYDNYVRAVSAFGTEDNASSAQSLSKTSAPYKVGDYYNDGTKEGIVFAISNGGYSGKIVSLEENKCKWSEKDVKNGATSEIDGMYNMQKIRSLSNWQNDYPAFAWCASLGDGWYLPALEELKAIYAKRTAISKALKAKGKPGLSPLYWSSTQVDRVSAWLVYMLGGYTDGYNKLGDSYVRAVSAFGTEDNASSAQSLSKTSAPYKVGDYYNDGTKEGIVFAISNGGYSGKIVSLEQIKCMWSEKNVKTDATSETDGMYNMQKIRSLSNWQNDYPAFAWCASLGDGWYLPAFDELQAIYAKRTAINKALKAKGIPELSDFYWSSTQLNMVSALVVHMTHVHTLNLGKTYYNYVRAVSAF